MKKTLMIAAAVAAILAMSLLTVAMENHVRWNGQLDECVYYFTAADGSSVSCYVAESECDRSGRDAVKEVDSSTCYYVPRSEQERLQESGACKEFVEGDLIVLKYQGEDPDGDKLTYTFGEPFDENQEWQTERGDAGTYHVDVTVSDGKTESDEQVCFRILSGNHAPVLSVKDVAVNEGELVRLKPTCSDEDGDAVKLTYGGYLTGSTWQTGYEDAGTYHVSVTCTDSGGLSDTEEVTITVEDVNRRPVLEGLEDLTVEETGTVRLRPSCTDPEGEPVTIAYSGDMTTDTWTTGYDDAGLYQVRVTCTDASGLSTSERVKVTVLDKNRPPTITAMVVKG